MRDQYHLLTLASAATLALTLNHNALAAEAEAVTTAAVPATAAAVASADSLPVETTAAAVPATPPASTAPTETAAEAAAPPTPAEVARQQSEQRRADAMEQRGLRYDELRQRAAQAGVELPETPPWEAIQTPEMPALPTPPSGIPGKDMMSAEERAAHIETMRDMTQEERLAEREIRWAEMRERAAERGIDLPETPPWKAAMERRKAMQEQWDAYRETVEAMTDEQREAAQAMFGQRAPAGGPAPFRHPPLPGIAQGGATPGQFAPPAIPGGHYGPCGRMPCKGYPHPRMRHRPPMMYPWGTAGGAQAPIRPMGGGY